MKIPIENRLMIQRWALCAMAGLSALTIPSRAPAQSKFQRQPETQRNQKIAVNTLDRSLQRMHLAYTVLCVRIEKQSAGIGLRPWHLRLPRSCTTCRVLNGPLYGRGQNALEYYFCARVPTSLSQLQPVRVVTPGTRVRAVIENHHQIPFQRTRNGALFALPVQVVWRPATFDLHTELTAPGITVRIEHAYPQRLGGPYARQGWPIVKTERAAALNLEFGLWAALDRLRLGQYVLAHHLGVIHLMGFDTNDPLGHKDYPPHVHIILRWPHFAGSQAPHIYLNRRGVLTGSIAETVDGLPDIPAVNFRRGTDVPAIDDRGEIVYALRVNARGDLIIQDLRLPLARVEMLLIGQETWPGLGGLRQSSPHCRLEPRTGTFAHGLDLACSGRRTILVRVKDDTNRGLLRVHWGGRKQNFHYNPLTMQLLAAKTSAALGKSH